MMFDEGIQRLLFLKTHAGAQRVLQAAHQPARLDGEMGEAVLQDIKINAFAGVDRNFDSLQLEPLQDLKRCIKSGCLYGNQIARPRRALQAQIQGLHGAVGNNQLLKRKTDTTDHVAQGYLTTQISTAF